MTIANLIHRAAPPAIGALAAAIVLLPAAASAQTAPAPAAAATASPELPVHVVPNLGPGAEFYFSPDNTHIIGDAETPGQGGPVHVYTIALDGSDMRLINDKGVDACTYYFPDGKHIVWTSTRDHPELAKSSYSDPMGYPQGAELYSSDLYGHDVKRLTNNGVYDAEVSVSRDATWMLFGSQRSGKMELWRMNPDGSDPVQITHMAGWEPGGAFIMPDDKTIIFRAWRSEDAAKAGRSGLPMTIYLINKDGTNLRQLTHDSGTNWAPFPAPDGHHYVFVKVIAPHNYAIYLGDVNNDTQTRLTYSNRFDGYPSISPDGHWMVFTSTRDAAPGTHDTRIYLMDISSLHLGPPQGAAAN